MWVILSAINANAAGKQAASCSSTDVQTAVNNAATGDVISLPAACAVTWNSAISIPGSKGITLNGNGARVTRGSVGDGTALISVSVNAAVSTRITGFSFTDSQSSGGYFITLGHGTETSAKFRVDNCSFTGMNMGTHLKIADPIYGVIDHNTFTWSGNNEIIHNEGYGSTSTAGWSNDVVPGSGDAVYIEDNTFINQTSGNPAYFFGGAAVQSYYGARTVFRYNNLTMAHVDQHGTAGMIGARWWEIYENTFNIVPNGNQDNYVRVRAGSGVIFNNHKSGSSNGGAGTVELLEEDSGYPALYQVGRGKNQVLDPAYVWNNDSLMSVASGSSNVQVNRDFYLTQKPGYTPYTYPHPLVTGGVIPTSPQAPSNLRITP
ncbi:MAG TPA: hypothetical protein VH583_22450 [Vicinamibacterales bacterium]|jgi:hypothetical protein